MDLDLTKSLAELTGTDWGPPPEDASSIIQERHRLHRVPLGQLSDHNLTRFIKCGIDTAWTIPRAISRLEADPESFGMLAAVLDDLEFAWLEHPDLVLRVRKIIGQALNQLGEWDGSAEAAYAGLANRCSICERWAVFEMNLSLIKT